LCKFKNIPAVRSVTEFGYDEKLVKEAYESLLQKAGKSDITSTELLEAIFSLEDNSRHTQENADYNKQQMENSQSEMASAKQVTDETTIDPEPECMYCHYKL
ncbi:hypothetical protein AM593_07456, partial [Mytilus galloprovincialis]